MCIVYGDLHIGAHALRHTSFPITLYCVSSDGLYVNVISILPVILLSVLLWCDRSIQNGKNMFLVYHFLFSVEV